MELFLSYFLRKIVPGYAEQFNDRYVQFDFARWCVSTTKNAIVWLFASSNWYLPQQNIYHEGEICALQKALEES